jgi:hypothetical protein
MAKGNLASVTAEAACARARFVAQTKMGTSIVQSRTSIASRVSLKVQDTISPRHSLSKEGISAIELSERSPICVPRHKPPILKEYFHYFPDH